MISLDKKSTNKSLGLGGIYYDYSGGPVPGIYKTDSIFSLTGKSDYNINNIAAILFHNNMNTLSLKQFNSIVKFTRMNIFNNNQDCKLPNPILKFDITKWPLCNRSIDNTRKLSEYQEAPEYSDYADFLWFP